MGFFKNTGLSLSHIFDVMEFEEDHGFSVDIGNREVIPDMPGAEDIISKSITRDPKTGEIVISIKRRYQKRARKLRCTIGDIISIIEKESPNVANMKISKIVLSNGYFYNTYGYRGKAIRMTVHFGDLIARGGGYNGYLSRTSEIYEDLRTYWLGHKTEEYAKYYDNKR